MGASGGAEERSQQLIVIVCVLDELAKGYLASERKQNVTQMPRHRLEEGGEGAGGWNVPLASQRQAACLTPRNRCDNLCCPALPCDLIYLLAPCDLIYLLAPSRAI